MTDVWDEDFDSSSSQFYFVHRASKETRWKLPDPTALERQSAEWHGLEDASTGPRARSVVVDDAPLPDDDDPAEMLCGALVGGE